MKKSRMEPMPVRLGDSRTQNVESASNREESSREILLGDETCRIDWTEEAPETLDFAGCAHRNSTALLLRETQSHELSGGWQGASSIG
jgi:hypothetical protein